MKLQKVASVEIIPTRSFDFDSTFHKPDHFTSGDNHWQPGIRWQTWYWEGRPYGLKIENKGKVRVTIYSDKKPTDREINSLIEEVKYRYNLDLDLSGFYTSLRNDPMLKPIIRRWHGMRPGHPSSLYEYLIIGVVLQNATVRRSIQMFKALLENYGTLLEYDKKKLCIYSCQ